MYVLSCYTKTAESILLVRMGALGSTWNIGKITYTSAIIHGGCDMLHS